MSKIIYETSVSCTNGDLKASSGNLFVLFRPIYTFIPQEPGSFHILYNKSLYTNNGRNNLDWGELVQGSLVVPEMEAAFVKLWLSGGTQSYIVPWEKEEIVREWEGIMRAVKLFQISENYDRMIN